MSSASYFKVEPGMGSPTLGTVEVAGLAAGEGAPILVVSGTKVLPLISSGFRSGLPTSMTFPCASLYLAKLVYFNSHQFLKEWRQSHFIVSFSRVMKMAKCNAVINLVS